ncbi:MAG: hypothetical protein ACJAT7_002043 [Psychromonas sp.]|jgi:hypothetical protein|uniref:thrombospondin type 3 repeat-containing protein n=1 Tax=Psychromonas sp. TaxID=1884585 RepID=UPI0039E3F66F
MKIRSRFKKSYRLVLATLFSSVIIGCGGGSGDKNDQFRLNQSTVQFSAVETDYRPLSKSVTGSVIDVNQNVYIFVDASNTRLLDDAYVSMSGTSGTLTFEPTSPSNLTVGSHSETVRVSVCFDASCQSHLSGSPANISVMYDVSADPLLFDSDDDGVPDVDDVFPNNANESFDADNDGLGDNEDPDADNDGVVDEEDALPRDATESLDTDLDGIGNNGDTDDDNDGVSDSEDVFPLDGAEWSDFDGDALGDNTDTDDDNDTYLDDVDAFPFNGLEWADNDGDGEGDNADLNDDNDFLDDENDPFPYDPSAPGVLVSVSSGVAITNTESRFILSGSQISENDNFYVNGQEATINILSPTLVELITTPTDSGELEIAIRHDDVSYKSSVSVTVVDPVYFPYSIVSRGGSVSKAYYDATRQAVYYQNNASSQLTQLRYTTGGGWDDTSIAIADLRSFSLNHNNNLLVAMTSDELVEIEMDDLYIVNSDIVSAGWNTVLSDGEFDVFGRLTIVTDYQGSGSTSILSVDMDTFESESIASLYNSAIASSSDGSFILLGENGLSPVQPLVEYQAVEALLQPVGVTASYSSASIDATGNRILVNNTNLYDREFGIIAQLNAPTWIPASDLSHDGNFIIAADFDGGLHYFDVSDSRNELVTPAYSSTLDESVGTARKIVISDDQLTVFVFAENKTVVVPVWQLMENSLGSSEVCPAAGCGDVNVAEGVPLPGGEVTPPPADQEPSPAAHVSPVYAALGETIEVLITGSGFVPASVVQFDDVLAENIRYISDEVLTARVPATLATGDYIVTVDGHQGNAPVFSIIEQQSITDNYWALSGYFNELLYVAEQNILIGADSSNNNLVRIDLSNNSITTQSVINLSDVTWCQEDGNLYAATGNAVHHYDIDTLDFVDEVLFVTVDRLECVAENKLLLTSENQWEYFQLLDIEASSLLSSSEFAGYPSGSLYSPTVDGVSRRGDVVIFGESGISSPDRAVFNPYNLSYALLPNSGSFTTSSWSADGDIGIINNVSIVNDSLSELADVTDLDLGYPTASAVTPSGNYVYAVIDSTIYRISVSDAGLSVVDTYEITEGIGFVRRVTTSLDGKTVFAAGANGIIAVNM